MARPPEELVEASVHVLYEVDMLRATATGIATEINVDWMSHNAFTESFVVHARNLTHFLFPESPYRTDILAEHFFDTSEHWESLRGRLPEDLEDVRARANKQMAHITYDRLEFVGEAKRWAYLEIFTAIQVLIEVFRLNANSELLHPDWDPGDEGVNHGR